MKRQTLTSKIARRINLERSSALLLVLALLLALAGIQPAFAAGLTLIVDTSSDANLTACTAAPNDCSLRGAINAANSAGGSNTIGFDGTVFYFGGSISLGSDLPAITSTLTIAGPGATLMTVNGNNHHLFYVNTGAHLTLTNLTLANGSASFGAAIYIDSLGTATVTDSDLSGNVATNNGGAIYVVNGTLNLSNTTLYNNNAGNAGAAIYSDAGMLTLSDCAFTSNDTTNSTGLGGALYNRFGGLSVTGCTFTGNFSPTGGAIYNDGGSLKLINSTLTSNSGHTGAGLYSGNFGTTLITNSTFSLNNATINGGVYNANGTLTLNNSIFAAGNGGACYRAGGTINAQNSLISDGLGCVTNDLGGNLTGDPKLGGLGNNGGPTNTIALQDSSPAINAGSNALALDKDGNPLLYDQRGSGYDRIANGTVDMGAYEATYTYNFVVDTTSDADLEGCSAAANDCSLRGAINLANTLSGTDTITFDSSVFATNQTITLTSTLPTVTTPMIINGPGEALLTVDGIDTFRVFYADTGSDLTLTGMTVANGNVTGAGGGIYVDGASLTVSNATFSSNDATDNGGAIALLNGGSATLTSCTLSGNGSTQNGGAIALATGTSAQFTDCSLSGNTAGSAGGAIYTGGTLTITGSTFTGNTTTASGGGGIFVQGLTTSVTTTVSSSTFTGNTAQTFGGGIAVVSGNVIIGDSTFNNNSGTNGGGVEGQGANVSITIFNSTLSGNTAGNLGGGIHLGATVPSTTITNTTIAGNSAANNGGGINVGGTATLNNSLVAYNTGGGVQCSVPGLLTVQSSLIQDTSCNVGTGNLSGDPLLGALANNGGATATMALQDGSPAINAGDNALAVDASSNPLSYDQRGSGYDRILGGTVDMGAYELAYTPDFVVDTTSDANLEGCSVAANDCSLRGAINLANAISGTDTITFDSTVFSTAQTITLTSTLPNVTSTMIINGPGADLLTVNGGGLYRVLNVDSVADLTLDNLTIANGNTSNSGGGVNNNGIMTLTNSVLSGNSAVGGIYSNTFGGSIYNTGTMIVTNSVLSGNLAAYGGGIYNHGTLTVTGSTLSGNMSTDGYYGGDGGGIYNNGTLTATGSTFTGNIASFGGGGIANSNGTTTVTNSTFTGNIVSFGSGGGIVGDGAGIFSDSGTTTVTNSTIAGNAADHDGSGVFANGGILNLNNSLIANNTGSGDLCSFSNSPTINAQNTLIEDNLNCVNGTNVNNLTGDPLLSALADNGGPTQTMALLDGSPAINAGANALAVDANTNPLSYDQRGSGYDRVIGGTVDMGAYEATYTYNFVVDTTSDADLEGCSAAANDCSLRGAINLANTVAGTDTVTFDSSVFSAPQTITLGSSLPNITSTMIINGPGAALLTVDGGGLSRVFFVDTGANLTLDSLTIANGYDIDYGGGIYNSGTLTLTNSTLSGNHADYGGGLYNISGTLTVSNSTLSGNSARFAGGFYSYGSTVNVSNSTLSGNSATSYYGGGIYMETGMLTVTNSTLSANSAADSGGGIYNGYSTLTLTNSTLSDNSASNAGGGIYNNHATLTVNNSIVANSTSGSDCVLSSGTINAQNSLIEDGLSCVNGTNTNNLTGDPDLGTLTGSPAHYPLNAGSIAINAGSNALAVDANGNPLSYDQRGSGYDRIQQGTVDMGAYELSFAPPAPTITTQPQSQTIFSGQTADLSVVASGSNLSYQWYQGNSGDTSTPVGTDSASFTTLALTADTSYWVRVSNPGSSADSDTATVTVQGAPVITTQPQSPTIFSGQTADFSVVASGANLSYQWYQGNSGDTSTPVGTDSASFTTPTLTADTSYWVRVSNPGGDADSNTATVTVTSQGGQQDIILLDSQGNGLAGATVQYYLSVWHDIPGSTGSDGKLSYAGLGLSGNITFRISYANASIQKQQNIDNDPEVAFRTTAVSMKLLASDGVTELNSTAKYYAGKWNTFGSGSTTTSMELLPTSYTFQVSYGGASIQKKQDVSSDPNVVFQTTAVSMQLLASDGATELNGTAEYYASSWNTFGSGSTTTSMELLPTSYTFSVTYAGASVQIKQDVSSDPVVVFQTIPVSMQLFASDGTSELTGTAEYYAGKWNTFGSGSTTTSMELLPTSYTFRVSYGGASIQKKQDVSSDPNVVFQTTAVSMKLLASDGATELNGTAEYYASSWNTFGSGSTTTSMELLPTSYTFRVSYGGASIQKKQDVSTDPNVVFQTTAVSMQLLVSDGATELNGTAEYYASSWNTFGSGSTTTSMELLPTSYTFRVTYAGASVQIKQDVGSDSNVVFKTGSVHSDSGTATKYYAGSWQTFTQDMELLPGDYPFRFSDGTLQTTFTMTASEVNHIH